MNRRRRQRRRNRATMSSSWSAIWSTSWSRRKRWVHGSASPTRELDHDDQRRNRRARRTTLASAGDGLQAVPKSKGRRAIAALLVLFAVTTIAFPSFSSAVLG